MASLPSFGLESPTLAHTPLLPVTRPDHLVPFPPRTEPDPKTSQAPPPVSTGSFGSVGSFDSTTNCKPASPPSPALSTSAGKERLDPLDDDLYVDGSEPFKSPPPPAESIDKTAKFVFTCFNKQCPRQARNRVGQHSCSIINSLGRRSSAS